MRVVGFTFIRNAIKYDYPVREAILSILPICDEVVVAVGNSEDDTLDYIRKIAPGKIRIIETVWDDKHRHGGEVLAQETNKALAEVSANADWAFYIQGDEVIHEADLPAIQLAMQQWKDRPEVDGLLFDYLHFYGSYDYVGSSPGWYRKEIRIVRPGRNVYSYRDAQGFRKEDNKKLCVKQANAKVFHYGWVKEPKAMQLKQKSFHKLWHDDEWMDKHVGKNDEFDYSGIDALAKYAGTHPQVMHNRIEEKNWDFEFDISFNRMSVKNRLKRWVHALTGYLPGEYKNYKVL